MELTPELKERFRQLIQLGTDYSEEDVLDYMFESYQLDREEWIPVSERLPEYELEVQICNNLDEWISQGYYSKYELKGYHEDWFDSSDNQCPCYPTHWKLLPVLPQKPLK